VAKDPKQYEMFVPHDFQGSLIEQRAKDGYINATAMCRAAEREFKHYNENKTTKAFITELSAEVGIPTSELIQSVSGGAPHRQGTWVHPQVAIHLAQWLSAKFAVQVARRSLLGSAAFLHRPVRLMRRFQHAPKHIVLFVRGDLFMRGLCHGCLQSA
jgi:hypothetical protein